MTYIGSLKLQNWLIMAPMAGITDLAFRLMARRMGAGMVFTEMVSAEGLIRNHKKTLAYLRSAAEERPLAVQIFGSNVEAMAAASQMVVDSGADAIDINMGCPVKKVIKTGAGASLLRRPQQVQRIVGAIRRVCPLPLTVKVRTGWRPDEFSVFDLARLIEDCGADAITVHPRFASQGFNGRADWQVIAGVKNRVRIPVIGNGDVRMPEDALQMKAQTGCDAVMIGRAAIGRPWIFSQILALAAGNQVPEPTVTQRKALLLDHFRLTSRFLGEHRAARKMRGFITWYTKGLPHGSRFRGSMNHVKDFETLCTALDGYFTSLQSASRSSVAEMTMTENNAPVGARSDTLSLCT